MPLIKGYSPEVIQKNIETLIKEGHTPEEAVAIAKDIARKAREDAGKKAE